MDRLERDFSLIYMVLAGADFWTAYKYFVGGQAKSGSDSIEGT